MAHLCHHGLTCGDSATVDVLQARIETLKAAADEVKFKYCRHWLGCDRGTGVTPCTCGLDDALAALDAAGGTK